MLTFVKLVCGLLVSLGLARDNTGHAVDTGTAVAVPTGATCVLICKSDGGRIRCQRISALPAGGPMMLILAADEDDTPDKDEPASKAEARDGVWIGVRVTPIPEPLAAHLKRSGLMIANIVRDSPADKAGLERYDVIVSFNDKAIENMDDLVDAIRQNGADKEARMVIVRGGQEQTVTITPARRPKELGFSYRYDEPESMLEDEGLRYFGHFLRRGKDGDWILEPLGPLDRLPDDVRKKLRRLGPLGDADSWKDWQEAWKEWAERWQEWAKEWQSLGGHGFWYGFGFDDDDDDFLLFGPSPLDEHTEITILRTEDDGSSIRIERRRDGTIKVERTDPDGKRESATYESADELRREDPEAYRLFRRFVGGGLRARLEPPRPGRLRPLQRRYQHRLEERLRKAQEEVERARRNAGDARRRVRTYVEKRVEEASEPDGRTRQVEVSVRYDSEKGYVLEITEDGVRKRFEFRDLDEFRRAEPDLYERFREVLEQASEGREEQVSSTLSGPRTFVSEGDNA